MDKDTEAQELCPTGRSGWWSHDLNTGSLAPKKTEHDTYLKYLPKEQTSGSWGQPQEGSLFWMTAWEWPLIVHHLFLNLPHRYQIIRGYLKVEEKVVFHSLVYFIILHVKVNL
jgi:hypothetical protein